MYVASLHLFILFIQNGAALLLVNSSAFQTGLEFYYWDYYRYKKVDGFCGDLFFRVNGRIQIPASTDGDSGEPNEKYVAKKYDTFKQEICEYEYLSIKHYQNIIIPKVTQYINTKRAKRTIVRVVFAPRYYLHYDIQPGAEISFNHLVALCLYTDFSNLCTDFSKSFRRIHNYESMDSVKARNRNYHFMSKYLRECVELFGDYNHIYSNNKLEGPFYSGLSFVAKFDITDITLFAPTSTSRELAVAQRFTGDGDGILIEFENHIQRLRGFGCEWISQFKEESEHIKCKGMKSALLE